MVETDKIMGDLVTSTGVGSISGLMGIAIGWLGFKTKVADLDKRISGLSGSVRYEDTCDQMHAALKCRLKNIEKMNEEMRTDIKELLKR